MMNGVEHVGRTQAEKACELIGYGAALRECAQRLKESGGAIGVVTFVLYPDGSAAFKPQGTVTPGLCHVIAQWGTSGLMGWVREAQAQKVANEIKAVV